MQGEDQAGKKRDVQGAGPGSQGAGLTGPTGRGRRSPAAHPQTPQDEHEQAGGGPRKAENRAVMGGSRAGGAPGLAWGARLHFLSAASNRCSSACLACCSASCFLAPAMTAGGALSAKAGLARRASVAAICCASLVRDHLFGRASRVRHFRRARQAGQLGQVGLERAPAGVVGHDQETDVAAARQVVVGLERARLGNELLELLDVRYRRGIEGPADGGTELGGKLEGKVLDQPAARAVSEQLPQLLGDKGNERVQEQERLAQDKILDRQAIRPAA